MTDLLEKHTEMYKGERRWRADSDLEERYQKIDEGSQVLMADRSFRDDLFAVLKEMGFEETSHPDVVSLGNVKVLWDLKSGWLSVKNQYRVREIPSLRDLCPTVRLYWGDSSILDMLEGMTGRRRSSV
jgi:hypothetical protein